MDMTTIRQVIKYCLTFEDVFEDYPFGPDTAVMRHRHNKKTFVLITERENSIWINVKGKPQDNIFWRDTYKSVIPGYHMNKEHWNSIILDGSVPESDIKQMIGESYNLTKPRKK